MSSSEPASDPRLLGRYLRPERRALGGLVGLLTVAMLLPLAGPLLIGRFVDSALAGDDTTVLIHIALWFLAATLTADALQLVVTWLSVRLAWRVGNRLRHDLCRHALSLELAWHGSHSPGQLIERIDGDIDAVTRFSSTAVLHLVGNAILLVGVLVVSAFIDWRASLLILVTVLAAIGLMARLRRAAVPFYDHEREVNGTLYGDIEERLGGLEDLRANGAGDWAEHKLQQHSSAWWWATRRAAVRGDGGLAMAGTVFAVGSVVTLAFGVWSARQGAMSVGTVLVLLRFSQLIADPLWRVAEQLAEAQKAVAGSRRAASLLATEPAMTDGTGPPLADGPLPVELRNVTFGYGTGHAVLHGVDLVVPAGTSLGVVGRTGSGKTTLGRLVARLWDTEQGSVLVGETDVRTVRQSDLRRRVGVVTQEVELFRASLRDNLTVFGAVAADDAAIEQAIGDVGLGQWLASLPHGLDEHLEGTTTLSAGEGQLLAFARLLLSDPSVVVMDEASSRLDPSTEARLEAATARLLEGRTAIIIAHRLTTLDRVDQIAVIDRGRLAEHGERATLAADPSSRFHGLLAAALGDAGSRR